MRPFLTFWADAARAFAGLVALTALAPAAFDPGALDAEPNPAWIAVALSGGVLVVGFLADAAQTARWLARGLLGVGRRVHRLVPRRGGLARWYHYAFREPLTAPDAAREALAALCGYRLRPGDDRIVALRPGLRRRRLGVRVTVARRSKSSRHWRCLYVRWVEDPHEFWLLRSALSPVGEPATPAESIQPLEPSPLEALSGTEIDALVRLPAAGSSAPLEFPRGDRGSPSILSSDT